MKRPRYADLEEKYNVPARVRAMLPHRLHLMNPFPEIETAAEAMMECRERLRAVEQKVERVRSRVRSRARSGGGGVGPRDEMEADIVRVGQSVIESLDRGMSAAEKCDLYTTLLCVRAAYEGCYQIDHHLEELVVYGTFPNYYYEPHEQLLACLRIAAMLVSADAIRATDTCQCACERTRR